MPDTTFMILMQGVSGETTGFRVGARYALLIFVKADTETNAINSAIKHLSSCDWHHAIAQRIKPSASDPKTITKEVVRDTAVDAEASGFAFIVYKDEIKLAS